MSEIKPHSVDDFTRVTADFVASGHGTDAFRLPGTNARKFLRGLVAPLATVEARFLEVLKDLIPAFSYETLLTREEEAALPGACTFGAQTLQERRRNLLVKWQASGGDYTQYFESLAETMGYSVTVEVWQSFICGISECGDGDQIGDEDTEFIWSVTVHGPRITYFRCGESECGDYLADFMEAQDLECLFQKYGPAEMGLVFFYEE